MKKFNKVICVRFFLFDASFRPKSLIEVVREGSDPVDFKFPPSEILVKVENALTRAMGNGNCFSLNFTKRNGREICFPKDYESALLLRRLNENIRRITKVRQTDRSTTISCLKQLLGNGVPYVVAKFDIKKFYSSINRDELRNVCNDKLRTSGSTRKILDKFFSDLDAKNVSGVPAGLALSGALSEIFLAKLDESISRSEGIHFYSRYVDDIIIIAAPHVSELELTNRINRNLPRDLLINSAPGKKEFLLLQKNPPCLPKSGYSFDYLGYSFSVSEVVSRSNHDATLDARRVKLDISKSKIQRRKTRFILSIKQYLKDGNQGDLLDRFLLINSGYNFFDQSSGRWLSSGLCNSYPLIDFPSPALKELGSFYRGVFSSSSSQFAALLSLAPLDRQNRKRIQYIDLCQHVQQKKYVGFNDAKLAHLMGVWKHV